MGNAADFIPALKYGHKIYPQNLAALAGTPVVGNVYYVDGVNGSDSDDGKSLYSAFASLYKAHSVVTDNNYDMIIVAPGGTGSGSGTSEDTAVSGGLWTFSKNLVTVVGAAAPSLISPRSRILWDTASQSVNSDALLTISGSGNRFVNLQFGTFVDNNVLVKVTGDRNVFSQVHFAGIGDATAGDDAAARSLWLADGDENLFEDCTIGLDTIARSTTNAEIELSGQSQRNIFRGCRILAYADNAGHLFAKFATAQDIDRFVIFDHCLFLNGAASAATTMTVAFDSVVSLGGAVILSDSWLLGATDWADDFSSIYTAGSMGVATAATAGLMAVAA